jgi:hypothetical protein
MWVLGAFLSAGEKSLLGGEGRARCTRREPGDRLARPLRALFQKVLLLFSNKIGETMPSLAVYSLYLRLDFAACSCG